MTTAKTLEPRSARETTPRERTRTTRTFVPEVDIFETKDELTLHADMPGVSADDIDIHFEKGELSIHGKVPARQAEGTRYLFREYEAGDFFRSFQISEVIDANQISAQYKDGVLTLRLPKVEALKPRKIAVSPQS